MRKRPLILCVSLVLLLGMALLLARFNLGHVAAGPPEAPEQTPDWERVGYWYIPRSDDLVTEMEFTMRWEPPSEYSGYLETELYTSDNCDQCDATTVEFGMRVDKLFHTVQMYVCVYEGDHEIPWWPLAKLNSLEWDRRHHQFRFEVKRFGDKEFLYKIWDCDTQELLYNESFELIYTQRTGNFSGIFPTIEWSDTYYDAYAVWEGHWVKHESDYAYRWDRAPWVAQGPFYHDTSEADLMDYGPVLHLYDDHPKACTGGLYWPTTAGCEWGEEPIFDGKSGDLDPDELTELRDRLDHPNPERDAVLEALKTRSDKPMIARASEYETATYLPHVLNGLEGQAHWNRIDMWWSGYY